MKPDLTLPASLLKGSIIYGWRRQDKYLYIGKSLSTLNLLRHHHVIKNAQEDDEIDIWFCHASGLDELEKAFIRHFKPTLNKLTYEQGKPVYGTFRDAAAAKEIIKPRILKSKKPDEFTDEEKSIMDRLSKLLPDSRLP